MAAEPSTLTSYITKIFYQGNECKLTPLLDLWNGVYFGAKMLDEGDQKILITVSAPTYALDAELTSQGYCRILFPTQVEGTIELDVNTNCNQWLHVYQPRIKIKG